MRATGTKFYYCDCATGADPNCVPGSDAWDGLTASTPRQTGWKTKAKTMAAGDTVALCRGGGFTGDSTNSRNTNCSAGATCDVRDYTDPRFSLTAGDRRPYITTDRLVYLISAPSSQGYRYFNLQVTGGNAQGVVHGGGDLAWAPTDVDICNVRFHTTPLAVQTGHAPRWKVRQSQFQNITGNGVLFGSTDGELDGNYFANDSFGPNSIYLHPIYVTSDHTRQIPVERFKVTNNEVHACAPGAIGGSVAIVVHGQHEDLLIENNAVICDNPDTISGAQYGIAVDHGGYPEPGFFRRTVIRRNRVIGNGNIGIDISNAPDSLVEDNVVVMPARSGYWGISAGQRTARSGTGDDVNRDVTIRNNTIWFPSGASGTSYGIRVAGEGSGYNVIANAIYFAGSSGTCFNFPLAAGSYAFLDSNACNKAWGTAYDTNRVTLSSDPFVYAPTDFTPGEATPLVGAASTATTCSVAGAANQACSSPVAVNATAWGVLDVARIRTGTPYDIGAYER